MLFSERLEHRDELLDVPQASNCRAYGFHDLAMAKGVSKG
jgi:hypothetical protein